MEKRISGHTGLLALIGSPVGHSGSPAMYNYSFEKLGLDYAYVAFDIKEDKVKDAIAANDTEKMKTATESLQQAFYKVSEKIYQQNPGAAAGAQGQPGPDASAPHDENVYDADYKVVDDEENK